MIGRSATKAELLDRMERTRQILKNILRKDLGVATNTPEHRETVSEVIEALGALNGHPDWDV